MASRPVPGWAILVASVSLLIGGLAVLGSASPAGAAGPTTWYVAAGGSGSGCTDTAPCGTVSAAVAQAAPGDTVEVQGDVIGNVTVTTVQGTPAAPLTIEQWPGQAAGTLDANHSGTVLTVGSGAGVNLSGLTVANGSTSGPGGGIYNSGTVNVKDSTVSGNTSGNEGGGMENRGALNVTDSTISGNSAPYGGGGGIDNAAGTATIEDSNIIGNQGAGGGGITNNLGGGTVNVKDSTISGNNAITGGGISSFSSPTTVEDSTIAGNTAVDGGGIYLLNSGTTTVEGSTISGNTASSAADSVYNDGSTAILAGDILVASAAGECQGFNTFAFTDAGYNIDDDGSCGLSSTNHSVSHSTTIDSYLSTAGLAENGGPTETIALLSGAAPGDNPAQAAIPSTFDLPTGQAACSQPDQRGIARAAACDMGAYALSTATLYATAGTPASGADCTTVALACTLSTALARVEPGATIELVTAGTTAHYDGGYAVVTAGTSAATPVTVTAAPGQGGPPVLDGMGSHQVLDVASGVYLDLSGVTIEDGSTFSGAGGGIYNTGTLTVADSTISGSNAPAGGGIYSNATLTVTGSTISGNVGSINGGGIYDTGAVTVEDSTISGNTASTAGGGIYLGQLSSATVAASTISGNTAGQGGGIYVDQTTVNLAGDILATAGGAPAGGECFGIQDATFAMFFDAGYNIDDDGTCGLSSAAHSISDSSTIDASLAALADNGGPTKTMLPGAASPAARVIPPDTSLGLGGITLCVGNDQRGTGFPRPATGTTLCSIGAVEAPAGTPPIIIAAPAPQAISFTGPSSGTVGATVTLSATGGGSGNPVVFTVDAASGPGVCSVSGPDGATLAYLEGGTCVVDANQAGSNQWAAAPQVQALVAVVAVASSPPTGVGASISAATTTITVTWTAPSDAGGSPIGGYQVFRSTTPGQQGTLIATVTGTTYTDTTAVAGITYFYSVVAVTAGGISAPSQEVSATIPVAGATGSRFAATPDGGGWWIVHPDGGVFSYGTAGFYGSLPGLGISVRDIVGISSTPDGKGYWLVGADGGVLSFGDATFYGSMGGRQLNQPVVGMAATPDGKGYWLVASDGGIFAFGDAGFYGSAGRIHLNQPIVGMAATPDGKGYWLVASDGGVFAFGSARFYGSTGAVRLNRPVVGMAATPDGTGYWLVASDGGIFAFGQAGFFGSLGDIPQTSPVLGMAPLAGGGYQLIHSDGNATRFAS